MNLYNNNYETFINNILNYNNDTELELMEYNNEQEKQTLNEFIFKFQTSKNECIIEKLYSLLEMEFIFNKIWSFDEDIIKNNILKFDLNCVRGVSFIHEFIKILQNNYDDTIYNLLFKVLTFKYFKTKEKATKYFDELKNYTKNIKYLNVHDTNIQYEKFINLFDN